MMMKWKGKIQPGASVQASRKPKSGRARPEDLLQAASKGKLDRVRTIVTLQLVDVDAVDQAGNTALIQASHQGHADVVEYLVKAKAAVDHQAHFGITALMGAAENGHADTAAILIAAGANPNAHARGAEVVLDRDVHKQEFQAFASRHGGGEPFKNPKGDTALIKAAAKGHLETVIVLCNRGADVNAKGKLGMTALMKACGNGDVDVTLVLLTHGADLNATSSSGNSAHLYGSFHGRDDVLELLDNFVHKAWTPLHWVCDGGSSVSMLHWLAEKHPEWLSAKNRDGDTPVHLAARRGLFLEDLMTMPADLKGHNTKGQTPLDCALAGRAGRKTIENLVDVGIRNTNP